MPVPAVRAFPRVATFLVFASCVALCLAVPPVSSADEAWTAGHAGTPTAAAARPGHPWHQVVLGLHAQGLGRMAVAQRLGVACSSADPQLWQA
jgi:hypothetical protein